VHETPTASALRRSQDVLEEFIVIHLSLLLYVCEIGNPASDNTIKRVRRTTHQYFKRKFLYFFNPLKIRIQSLQHDKYQVPTVPIREVLSMDTIARSVLA